MLLLATAPVYASEVNLEKRAKEIIEEAREDKTAEQPAPAQEKTSADNEEVKAETKTAQETEEKTEPEAKKEEQKAEAKPEPEQEPKPEPEPKRPATLKVNINKVESIGLVYKPQDGGLGKDLWTNSRRSKIDFLIPNLPDEPYGKVQTFLTHGLLTTQSNGYLIEPDKDIEEDILTRRITKLSEMGAYNKAKKLYEQLDGAEPYNESLAKAGILAMLLAGENSLACIEYKTVEDRDFKDSIWNDLALYCSYTLGGDKDALKDAENTILKHIASNKKYRQIYKQKDFEELSLFSKAIMRSENALIVSTLSKQDIKTAPAGHIEILLGHPDISDEDKFLLTVRAYELSLISLNDLTHFYKSLVPKYKDATSGWSSVIAAYEELRTAKGDTIKDALKSAIKAAKPYGYYAMAPFAPMAEEISPEDVSPDKNPEFIKDIFQILHVGDATFDNDWENTLRKTLSRKNKLDLYAQLYTVALINSGRKNFTEDQINALKDLYWSPSNIKQQNYKKIIEMLDKAGKHIHNPDKIYEKGIVSAVLQNYAEPDQGLIDALQSGATEQRIGETVALSTLVLHAAPYEDLSPHALNEVVKSLNAVGFTGVTAKLLTEVALAH